MRFPSLIFLFCAFLSGVAFTASRATRCRADPKNIQGDRPGSGSHQRRTAATTPLPPEIVKSVSADTGEPVMFPSHGGFAWGLSTKPVTYGNPVSVLLWMYNSTDEPKSAFTCTDIDVFWVSGIDVFDSSGRACKVSKKKRSAYRPATSSSGCRCVPGTSCFLSRPTLACTVLSRNSSPISPGISEGTTRSLRGDTSLFRQNEDATARQ